MFDQDHRYLHPQPRAGLRECVFCGLIGAAVGIFGVISLLAVMA
jgi:hypothetical protein